MAVCFGSGASAAHAGGPPAFPALLGTDSLLGILFPDAASEWIDWPRWAASRAGIPASDTAGGRRIAILGCTHRVLAEKRFARAAAGRLGGIDCLDSPGCEFLAARDDFRLPGGLCFIHQRIANIFVLPI